MIMVTKAQLAYILTVWAQEDIDGVTSEFEQHVTAEERGRQTAEILYADLLKTAL